MKNNESTAMTVADTTDITPSGFVNADALALLQDVMAEDAAGLEFQLDRIKFAAGGTTILEIPGDGDEPEMVKSLSCVSLSRLARIRSMVFLPMIRTPSSSTV